MLNVTGECTVKSVYKKTTANGFKMTDLVLEFPTSVCIDKAKKIYRTDTVRAFVFGHENLPDLWSKINLVDAQMRVNTWMAPNAEGIEKLQSMPELLLNKWEKV